MMKSLMSVILVSSALLFYACSKSSNDPEPQPPTGTNCRLDSIKGVLTYASGASYENTVYEYDNQNRCTAYKFNSVYSQLYGYGSDGRLRTCDIITGAIKNEERVIQYDAQGRVAGYISTPHPTNTASPDKLLIGYFDPIINFTYLKNNDTLSTRIFYFENGNNIRTEYFLQEYLVKIDSITYGSALDNHFPSNEIRLLTTSAPTSKNLPTRSITYDVTIAKRTWDESYTYEFDTDGKMVRKTAVAKGQDPTLNYRFDQVMSYSCR